MPVQEVVRTQRVSIQGARSAPEVHGVVIVREQADRQHVPITVADPEGEDGIGLPEDGEERARVRTRKRRPHALPAQEGDVLVEVFLDRGGVVGVLDGQARLLGVPDAVAARRMKRPPHRRDVGRQRHEIREVLDRLVPGGGERLHGQVGMLELDHREPLASSQVRQSPHERGLVHAGLEEWPHEVRAPALEWAAEHAERTAAEDTAAEVSDGARALADDPEAELDLAARREVLQPGSTVEEPT
jgi:hypothetical protein